MEDRQLLQRFVRDNSQEAFTALTARYLNLVYAVCRREMGDADAAEDVTQAVFLILARKAPHLGRNVVLSGWLFQTARFAAKNARLTAQRRAAYEQKAAEALMEQQTEAEDEHWAEIEPLLNQSLAALKAGERESVLLRFFQGASFAEVGTALGLSEDAARKRVTRSLAKMRQFFSKNGVIVPAIALPVLLTAHAAKAAPAACRASITHLFPSALPGHTTAALTGSHAYQLSEGTLKAMKIAQLKLAAGITAVVLGITTYMIARGTAAQPLQPLLKPGHIFQQVPGRLISAAQIADHCRTAYSALQTYQGTTTNTSRFVSPDFPTVMENNSTASISYARPGKIHVESRDTNGDPISYISDGISVEEKMAGDNGWKRDHNMEMAVAGATGISNLTAATIPAALFGFNWGTPFVPGNSVDPQIREDNLEGQACYVLTSHLTVPALSETDYVWIDEKTFLMHRIVAERDSAAQTITRNGKPFSLPLSRNQYDEKFTNERINQPIPGSTFTLPAVQ